MSTWQTLAVGHQDLSKTERRTALAISPQETGINYGVMHTIQSIWKYLSNHDVFEAHSFLVHAR